MKNFSGLRRGCQLRVDGAYGFEYLVIAIVRTAVQDEDWEWVGECGIDLCEWVGIDPTAFRQMMEAKRGRTM